MEVSKMTDSELAWHALALGLLRDGYLRVSTVERWAKERNISLQVMTSAVKALAIESFEHDGELYMRLSGKVVPILPCEVLSVDTYRLAAAPIAARA